jgi:hypothetical protein
MTIENFASLRSETQVAFAEDLLDKINAAKIFSDETNLVFEDVEADEVTGGLWIAASLANPIYISRKATWDAGDEDGAYDDPGRDADYYQLLRDDAKSAFKNLATELDGYKISLKVDDVEEDETIDAEVEVDKISHEDAGIGSYEFWGAEGFDSQPYVEVEGTITKAYDCNLTLFMEPIN